MNNAEYIKRILQVHAEEVNTLAMRNYKLEMALDKACEILATKSHNGGYMPKGRWQEILLKDEG